MTPTVDTLQGWLVIACLAIGLVSAAAGVLAIWDTVLRRHAETKKFVDEVEAAGMYHFTVLGTQPEHDLRVTSDRKALTARDLMALEVFARQERSRRITVATLTRLEHRARARTPQETR